MSAPRRPPSLAILTAHERPSRFRGALTGSVLAHALLLFVALYDFSCVNLGDPDRAAGGAGPRGGGGGGGGEVVGYMQLPAYIPPDAPAPEPQEQEEVPPEEEVLFIPQPMIADVPQSEIALRERQPINLAEVIGRGDGTGGGPGSGPGSGGGQGTGEGTGSGSATGPGTGGDGGDIYLPHPRFTTLPPQGAPPGVKGREHIIRFRVSATGDVLEIEFVTSVRNGDYRRRWLEALREYRFSPATTRTGEPIEAIFEMTITP